MNTQMMIHLVLGAIKLRPPRAGLFRGLLPFIRQNAVSLLAVSVALGPHTIHAQSINSCIDHCFSFDCGSYPAGSFQHDNCINQCIEYSCKKQNVNPWGAIAYSKPDKISGWAYEQADQATAQNMAMRYCTKQGGKQCQVVTTFSRTCASVAADGNVVGWASGGNKESVQQQALAQCAKYGGKNCAVEAWSCSAPNTATSSSTVPAPRSTPVPRAASWGAIAYSARDMGMGSSHGKDDRAAAEREAMGACAQRGKSCVLYGAFNKECGALAADGSFTGWGASADMKQAIQKATDECRRAGGRNCVPHVAFCSY